jgi:hypothetical protein
MGVEPILPPVRPHDQYVWFVKQGCIGIREPCRHQHVKQELLLLDLAALRPLLAHLYSGTLGATAIPPEDLFRSLLAMILCGVFSVDAWVDMMGCQPFYAVISGFAPTNVPAVGTFYLFMDRLLGLVDDPPKHLRRPRPKKRDTASQSKDKNRDTAKHQDIINRLVSRIIKQGRVLKRTDWRFSPEQARYRRYEAVLKAIFYSLFVPKSVALGLIDLANLYVTGDSTKLSTYANPHGKRLCKCPKDKPCTCKRRYQGLLARWGWDSYRGCFVYGHSLYELCAYSLDHTVQLPLVLSLFDANRHDSVLNVAALDEGVGSLQLPIKVGTFDKAGDALGFYRLGYEHWQISLVIPLNERSTGHCTYPQATIDDNGVPHCQAGLAMYCWGHCPDRKRLKWRCPLKATKGQKGTKGGVGVGKSCEHSASCSPSAYGRVVYTYPKSNYRLFTPIVRGSATWQEHYDHHSASERSHKRKKWDYNLGATRTAGRERIYLRVMLMAMAQHVQAWAALAQRQRQERGEAHTLDPAA